MNMSRIQLTTLMLSVISEIKHNMPLARNAVHCKGRFKAMVGLPKNATNKKVLEHMCVTYWENGLINEFKSTIRKFFPDTRDLNDVIDVNYVNAMCGAIARELGHVPVQEK